MTNSSAAEGLPRLLRLVAEECGEDAAMALARDLGGERVYAPEQPAGSTLERRAGPAVAACLSRHFAGEHVVIPHIADRLRAARREVYIAAHPGMTTNELARKLGMTRRSIQRTRRRLDARAADDPRQLSLFEGG